MRKIIALISILFVTALPMADAFAKVHAKGAKHARHVTYNAKEWGSRKPASIRTKKKSIHANKVKVKKHGKRRH